MKSIALFDMDGVLLTPGGYHRALAATVRELGRLLGYRYVELTHELIHAFEACGITNEWDSAAICFAALADGVWDLAVDIDYSAWPDARLPEHRTPLPDFGLLVGRLSSAELAQLPPLARARLVLPGRVHRLLDDAHSPNGISYRLQQELVLGSAEFVRVYEMPAVLDAPSYLLVHDRSNLTKADRERLLVWADHPGHAAAVFTNRPSLPPDGLFGTPEGELGARLVGLETLPLAGTGGVVWLEAQEGLPAGTYNKPHPVHGLAALRMAMGESAAEAFGAAMRLFRGRTVDGLWQCLSGVEVWVFEDSAGGLTSLRIAKELLAGYGVTIRTRFIGVSKSAVKQAALARAGAAVYPDLSAALPALFNSTSVKPGL